MTLLQRTYKVIKEPPSVQRFKDCKQVYLEITGKTFNSSCTCSISRCLKVLNAYYEQNFKQ